MIKRARTLILRFSDANLVAENYLAKTSVNLSELGRRLLGQCDHWQMPQALLDRAEPSLRAALESELAALSSASMLLWYGSSAALLDQQYETEFAWGDVAGYYHFSIRNTQYMTPVMSAERLVEKSVTTTPVPLYTDNQGYQPETPLPAPASDSRVLQVMEQRRSYRGFSDDALPLHQLAECLFAGLGITGFVKPFADASERLPFKLTPSGGGRNPYEAFIYVRRVDDLKPGVYHYSAREHTLGFVRAGELQPAVGDVVAGQRWFDHAAALVILVANFDRTMWKYPHPTGYRVVLLEAGHIAQNILLAATGHGLACTPTCAIDDSVASALTGCDKLTQSHVYTIALGRRSVIPTAMDPLQILPNQGRHLS